MIREVHAFNKVLENMETAIKNSPYKKGYIVEMSGIPYPTFYRKLKNRSFTVKELMRITEIMYPDEALRLELEESMEQCEKGMFMKHEDFMKQVDKEFAHRRELA